MEVKYDIGKDLERTVLDSMLSCTGQERRSGFREDDGDPFDVVKLFRIPLHKKASKFHFCLFPFRCNLFSFDCFASQVTFVFGG